MSYRTLICTYTSFLDNILKNLVVSLVLLVCVLNVTCGDVGQCTTANYGRLPLQCPYKEGVP